MRISDWSSDVCSSDLRYRVRLWDGDGFDEKRVLTDPMPTGRQILDLFDRAPADEHVLLMLSRSSGLALIDLAATINIRSRGAERFRSEERREGKVCASKGRHRWSPYHKNKNT